MRPCWVPARSCSSGEFRHTGFPKGTPPPTPHDPKERLLNRQEGERGRPHTATHTCGDSHSVWGPLPRSQEPEAHLHRQPRPADPPCASTWRSRPRQPPAGHTARPRQAASWQPHTCPTSRHLRLWCRAVTQVACSCSTEPCASTAPSHTRCGEGAERHGRLTTPEPAPTSAGPGFPTRSGLTRGAEGG